MSSALPLAKATAQSVLALTLAFSICFSLPLEKAHALDGRSAPAESNMGSSYDDNDATGNDADASPQSDSSAANALSHTAESGNPIVDWTACGTCRWMIDARGCLTIAPMEGADSGELSYWKDAPWYDYRDSITSAKIKDGVVAATTFRMFRDCSRLISVDLSGLDTSKVTEMGREDTWESGMFSGCTRLAYLDVSSLDTSNVTSMGCMFKDCSSLSTLDLSGFDTSSVTSMTAMFADCSSLSTLDLSGFNTSQVTDMSNLFSFCSSIASLDLSGLDTSEVEDMTHMFLGCSELTTLDLTSFDTSMAKSMDYMFYDCSSLKSVSLSQKFSFTGRGITRLCKLPKPLEKKGYTGLWVSSTDGMTYAPDEIPNYMAATYTAQIAFPDVDYSDWYGDAISFVSAKGLITGYTDGEKAGFFGVGDTLTRAQFATILWHNACPDEYAAYDPKTAVDTTGIEGSADGMYYTAAANWAVANGYITGIDNLDGTFDFAADKPVSFEQMITILARITATPDEVAASRGDLSAFVDGDMASSWSRNPLAWAHDLGLVEGYNDPDRGKLLCPGENVERQRAATVLARAFTMGVLK